MNNDIDGFEYGDPDEVDVALLIEDQAQQIAAAVAQIVEGFQKLCALEGTAEACDQVSRFIDEYRKLRAPKTRGHRHRNPAPDQLFAEYEAAPRSQKGEIAERAKDTLGSYSDRQHVQREFARRRKERKAMAAVIARWPARLS